MIENHLIQIAILVWGFAFCLISAWCMYLSSNYDKEKRSCLVYMQLFTAILLLCDALAYVFRGYPGEIGFWMVRLSNFTVFFMSDIVLMYFHKYVCVYLFSKEQRKTLLRVKAGYVIACVGAVLVVISQFTNLYYYFDADNYYHRNSAYILSLVIPVICMMLDAEMLIQFRKNISIKMLISMLSYIVLPLAAAAIQTVYYGISLINFSIGVSMIIMYIAAISELNQEMYTVLIRESKTKERLEIATVLNECVAELSSDKDIEIAINNLLEIINSYFEGDRSYIFEINQEKDVLVNTYEYVKNGVTVQKDNLQAIPTYIIKIWIESFEKNQVYFISDVEQEKNTPTYEILKAQDIERLLAVPICRENEMIGFLGVDNPRIHCEDATLLSSIQYFLLNSISERKRKTQLQYLSYRDMLTTLYNRNKYMEIVEPLENQKMFRTGVAYIDINGLKQVNDMQGHEAGDWLIKSVAKAIIDVLPENAYRIGGDEFVIICIDMDEYIFMQKIQKIHENVINNKASVSMGSIWEDGLDTLGVMLKKADKLMYQEKEEYHKEHKRN